MSFVSVNANDIHKSNTKNTPINRFENAVTFIENGIQYHVFINGDFEFNKLNNNSRYYNYNGVRFSNNSLRVYRDKRGQISRIGNSYIRYDYRGNVTKIGSIRMYYTNGLLRKVGDLKISYNSWDEPYFYGTVNNNDYYDTDFHFSINIGSIFNYNDRYFYNESFNNNYKKYKEDKNFYYYRANSNAKIDSRNQIIKRRKSLVTTRENDDYSKRSNSTTLKREDTKRRVTPKTKKETIKRKVDKKYEKRS